MPEKKKLYILTLEKIEQRYTKQWYEYWKQEFSKYFDVEYVDGKITNDKIEKGRFLDINKTNIWKAQQIEAVSILFANNKIKDGDIFLLMDGWNYSITAIKYMSQLNKIKAKIYAYLHAGTWDEWDFISQAGLDKWACLNEAGWFRALDGSFVSTLFHKKLICDYFTNYIKQRNINVVGFPMDWKSEIQKYITILKKKENLIVFPHRLDKEKQPDIFDYLKDEFPQYKFIKTLEVTKDKKEYYELLNKAKIVFSASQQETFGIGTVEGLMMGAIPLVPDRLSYVELYRKLFRYSDKDELKSKIVDIMEDKYELYLSEATVDKNAIRKKSLDSIKKMATVMDNG